MVKQVNQSNGTPLLNRSNIKPYKNRIKVIKTAQKPHKKIAIQRKSVLSLYA